MKELTTKQQRQISGGSSLVYVVTSIIIAAGTGLFRVMRSYFFARR